MASPTEIETMGQLIRAIDAMGEAEMDQLFFKLPMDGGTRVDNHLTGIYGRAKLELDAMAWVKSLPLASGSENNGTDHSFVIDTEAGQMTVNRYEFGPGGVLREIGDMPTCTLSIGDTERRPTLIRRLIDKVRERLGI